MVLFLLVPETEALRPTEPKFKDQATMVSFEGLDRLSLVVEYNQIGSLTSLGRNYYIRPRSNSIRRGSLGTPIKSKNLNSKADLLRSSVEFNQSKASSSQIITSNGHINRNPSVSLYFF